MSAFLAALLLACPQDPAGAQGAPAVAPPPARLTHEELGAVVEQAVDWLVAHQAADGSWGSHHSSRPIEVLASPPGSQDAFRIGTTALVVSALRDCPLAGQRGLEAADRGIDHLLEHYDVKRQSGMEHYNVWAFGYALETFGDVLVESPEHRRAAEIRRAAEHLVAKLGAYQTLDGGWGYLSLDAVPTFQPSFSSMSFTTATALVGLDRARRAGVEVPAALIDKAVAHLERSRLPDGAFLYGEYLKYRPRHEINERKGSACRNPLCHYALRLFAAGPADKDAELGALRDLLVRYGGLQRAALRRPIPHESHYAISGYFYLYGHAYAAYALAEQPPAEQAELWPELVSAVMVCREPDGSFWDYPLYSYHKPYGTGFALMALSRAWLFEG